MTTPTDGNRIVTAPCGCSWTLPMGQVQSRCAQHQEPSQPAFDAEAANNVYRLIQRYLQGAHIHDLSDALEVVWSEVFAEIERLDTAVMDRVLMLDDALRAIATAAGLDPGLEPDKIAEAVCGKLAELNEEIDALEKESDDEGLELGQAYQQIDALLAAAKQPKAAEAAGGKT